MRRNCWRSTFFRDVGILLVAQAFYAFASTDRHPGLYPDTQVDPIALRPSSFRASVSCTTGERFSLPDGAGERICDLNGPSAIAHQVTSVKGHEHTFWKSPNGVSNASLSIPIPQVREDKFSVVVACPHGQSVHPLSYPCSRNCLHIARPSQPLLNNFPLTKVHERIICPVFWGVAYSFAFAIKMSAVS